MIAYGTSLSIRRRGVVEIPRPAHAVPIGLENPGVVVIVLNHAKWLRLLVALHHRVVVIRGYLVIPHEPRVLVLRVSQVFVRVDF